MEEQLHEPKTVGKVSVGLLLVAVNLKLEISF